MQVMLDALSSYSGGARTYMRAVVPRLAALGARVTVVCRADQRSGFGLLDPDSGVAVHTVPAWVQPLAARLAYSATTVPLLAAQQRTDVLFCPTDHSPPASPCPVTLMIRNPTPYVKAMRTAASRWRSARELGMRGVTLASAWRSQRIIVVSQAALDATAAVIPLPYERVRVVHHGRDGRFVPPPSAAARAPMELLAVSSIYAFKNYPVLLDALCLLRQQHGLAPRLRLCGAPFDAQHTQELHAQVQRLGLGDQVCFEGEVSHADLVARYQRCTVFVMPSRLETFGHPYIEAMATGTPSVVGDIACAREMCGNAVRYAPPDDPAAFAQALAELLQDPKARARLAAAGPPRAQAFSWDATATQTLDVLAQSAGRAG